VLGPGDGWGPQPFPAEISLGALRFLLLVLEMLGSRQRDGLVGSDWSCVLLCGCPGDVGELWVGQKQMHSVEVITRY